MPQTTNTLLYTVSSYLCQPSFKKFFFLKEFKASVCPSQVYSVSEVSNAQSMFVYDEVRQCFLVHFSCILYDVCICVCVFTVLYTENGNVIVCKDHSFSEHFEVFLNDVLFNKKTTLCTSQRPYSQVHKCRWTQTFPRYSTQW